MKKLILVFLAIVMVASFSANVMAQSTASATATATIIAPIAISKTVDMNFGNVAVDGTVGTAVLAPAGTRSATGGVQLSAATPGTVTAASFAVTGQGVYTYAITLPSGDAYIITDPVSSETMIVNTFTSTPATTGALTAGAQTLLVGATLNAKTTTVAGVYTNATGFDVTVNYN
jgi:methionine-rich copper-binding protein CopC